MLAVIRASLGGPQSAWSDSVTRSLFDPAVPYSFAHFWARNSFGEADLRYTMFDPVGYADPRGGKDHGAARQALVEEALNEVARRFDPDWTLFEAAILIFTGQTDLFGGGAFAAKNKSGELKKHLPAAVFDNLSPYSSIVQEIGHAFGYQHEVGTSVLQDYASPYSAMSEEFSPANTWQRAPDMRLTTLPAAAFGRDEPLRQIGPFVPAALFLAAQSPTLDHPDSVTTIADLSTPVVVRLAALDKAIADWPGRRRCVAMLPPSPARLRTYYLEVRRKADYDQGLRFGLDGGAPAGLVVHSFDHGNRRIHYEGALAFTDQAGDLDFRSFAGRFIVRLLHFDPDRAEASFRVADDADWRSSGLTIDAPPVEETGASYSVWTDVIATPCGPASSGMYQYRTVSARLEIAVAAQSYGYEKPGYVWSLNGQRLEEASGAVRLGLNVRTLTGAALVSAGVRNCDFLYAINRNFLRITALSPWAAMLLRVQAEVVETSSEVMKNAYPHRFATADITVDNVRVEWDDRYMTAMLQCWRKYWHLEKPPKPGEVRIELDPRPKFDPRILDDFRDYLIARDAAAPAAVTLSGAQLVDAVRQVDPQLGEALRLRLERERKL